MFNLISVLCRHGCGKPGTLHQLWHCPEMRKLWMNVEEFICKLCNVHFQVTPLICLLGKKVEEVKSKENCRI